MVVAGLFKRCMLQFCFKMLVRKRKEFLLFVFCSHIRVREEEVSLQGCVAVWKQGAAGVCFCLGG